ncbi:hypothetical protein E2C01_077544 [Portunus trituberculatus]|uniref:Uncharacterized protein n=1 Tax=Portunus trituberculatus TaxID=210409 RepID=A0A5B7ILN2_PORTR|nr:hypothetical protein [Portunus trituberculatus]
MLKTHLMMSCSSPSSSDGDLSLPFLEPLEQKVKAPLLHYWLSVYSLSPSDISFPRLLVYLRFIMGT